MDITALQAKHIDLSNLPLDRLAASTQITQPEKIREVSRAFEAVLLRQILQETQKPAFKSKLIGDTATDGIYRDLVVGQLADSISKSGSFGLAKCLTRQLQRQTGSAKHGSVTAGKDPAGVRPSPGAAPLKSDGGVMNAGGSRNSAQAFPGDGRAPAMPPLSSLARYRSQARGVRPISNDPTASPTFQP